MDEPILAALIFTYNHKPYIAKCIESLVNQKTTYRYQVRIYDDCSTDGTTEICREYADKYPDKIRLTVQPENTYLKPYSEMQAYKATQEIDTKYFCIIDGDDCWNDQEKVQTAIDCLEQHPEYIGFAHDTCISNAFFATEQSYIHARWPDFENPVMKKAVPYFLTSSRIFRNCGFKGKRMVPIDYLIYFYHAVRGPIYYHDKMMSINHIGAYNNFGNMERVEERSLNSTFGFKVAKFLDFREDELAMEVQRYYNPKTIKTITRYKRVFGVKWGWRIWYFVTFVPLFGIECFDLNWVGSRKLIRARADNRLSEECKRLRITRRVVRKKMIECRAMEWCLRLGLLKNTALFTKLGTAVEKKKGKVRRLLCKCMHIKKIISDIK